VFFGMKKERSIDYKACTRFAEFLEAKNELLVTAEKEEGSEQKGERPVKKAIVTQDSREGVLLAFCGRFPDKISLLCVWVDASVRESLPIICVKYFPRCLVASARTSTCSYH